MKYEMNIETSRLRLRNFKKRDSDFIIKLWTSEVNTTYMGGPRSVELMEDNVKEYLQDPYADQFDLWTVEDKLSLIPVGHCGLIEKEVEGNNEIEVIYVISHEHQGKGYATEISKALVKYGLEEMKLKRIIALIKPENIGSAKVAVNIGMAKEKEVMRQNRQMDLYSICD
jgi:RimJ/RimL family protein N-acetyltransferase